MGIGIVLAKVCERMLYLKKSITFSEAATKAPIPAIDFANVPK